MKHIVRVIACVFLLYAAAPDPVSAGPMWSFDFDAAGGNVSGPPGSTVGWGYTITNNDDVYWLSVAGLSSDVFEHGTPDSTIFDFPVLGPGEIRTLGYGAGQGLFAFTWDLTAPSGFTNLGWFVLDAEFYDADPFLDGVFVEQAPSLSIAYSATVAPVPEPATLTLFLLAAPVVVFLRRRKA